MGELSVEQKLAINTKIMEDIGYKFGKTHQNGELVECFSPDGSFFRWVFSANKPLHILNIFDPDNTTDLSKAVEFYGIDVVKLPLGWSCRNLEESVHVAHSDRDSAMQQAVIAASGVEL